MHIDTLLSVPPPTAAELTGSARPNPFADRLQADPQGRVHITCDPAGSQLGSGGGTVHLLHHFKQALGDCQRPLRQWLSERQRLIVHAGGHSRRLPAYAAIGKFFMPIPMLPSLPHHSFNQVLADFQIPRYSQALREAGDKAAIMINSGDVMLDFDPLEIPTMEADIVGLGMQVSPAVARDFGVFFVRRRDIAREQQEMPIDLFLQKPSPSRIEAQLATHEFYVDTGMWLLSTRAVEVLFKACGWAEDAGGFTTDDALPRFLDLYTTVGTSLGRQNEIDDALASAGFGELSRAVVALPGARFFHVGSTAQLFTCLNEVQRHGEQHREIHTMGCPADLLAPTAAPPVWADSCQAHGLSTGGKNLLTGLPAGNRVERLARGWCLDVSPIDDDALAWRPYAVGDLFRGAANSDSATICGQPAPQWLAARELPTSETDVFDLRLYPLLAPEAMTQELLDWYFAEEPDPAVTRAFATWEKLSSREIGDRACIRRLLADRERGHQTSIRQAFAGTLGELPGHWFQQDFSALAGYIRERLPELAEELLSNPQALLESIVLPRLRTRIHMFLAELTDVPKDAETLEAAAFQTLRDTIVSGSEVQPLTPHLALKHDQIVWARSPVRLDLGGGWTDTPPYCMEMGGRVVNVGVMLNGQPPIQVIIRCLDEPEIRLRSIDLGAEEVVHTYAELADFNRADSAFSLPKAALYLCGFHPDFYQGNPLASLADQLRTFGGGLEVSLLCAVPKGSGLGTSSILAVTLLGAISRTCDHGFDARDLYHRVLAMEQLMTTGGGWQDQAGAIFRGLKRITTAAGPSQQPTAHNLPEFLLSPEHSRYRYLLYYTGLTRMAKNILQQIVRNMFLRERRTFETLELIDRNAEHIYRALLTSNEAQLARGIQRSWELNKRLDPDTTTAQIEGILETCGDDLAAAKLLGAGGGGYMLMVARSAEAGQRIRQRLAQAPPNPLARFVDIQVAESGMQVTVS